MTEDIDYKILFEKMQTENEGLRINILKLKNEEISFIEGIKEKIADIMDSRYAFFYAYIAFMIICYVVEPLIRSLVSYIIRRKNEG